MPASPKIDFSALTPILRLITKVRMLIPGNPEKPHFFHQKSATTQTMLAMPTTTIAGVLHPGAFGRLDSINPGDSI